jgi:hypothetical protein
MEFHASIDMKGPLLLSGSAGTAGQVLQSAGSSAPPTWGTAGVPGGSNGQVQFANAGAFAGASNVTIDSGDLVLANNASPTAPTTGAKVFAASCGGRSLPAFRGPTGAAMPVQASLGLSRISAWFATLGSTSPTSFGASALTTLGGTGLSSGTTVRYNRATRIEFLQSIASINNVAGWRHGTAAWTIGAATDGDGGFFFTCRWGPATGVSTTTNRAFVGLDASTSAPTDVEPSSITNMVGMGWDAADTNIQFMYRGAGSVTKVDLGANFAVPTSDRSKLYELVMYSPPGTSQSVSYRVTDLITGTSTSGTVSSNLPTNSTFLAPRGWMSVGGTSSVIGIAFLSLYLETDY